MQIKGLFIKEPWISLILDGKKTWEIRGSNTKIRGRIALIASGTGEVKGFVDIVDSVSLNGQDFENNTDKHQVNLDRYNSSKMPYKKTHAWIFKNPLKLEKGVPFKMKQGCVIWITLEDEEIYKKSLL